MFQREAMPAQAGGGSSEKRLERKSAEQNEVVAVNYFVGILEAEQ